MKLTSAIGGGVAGAVALTLIHETLRRLISTAPRMDLMGMEALEKSLEKVDAEVPPQDDLFKMTMAGDILSNSAYYSLAGIGKKGDAILRGALLGCVAGIGAVFLPKPMGLHPAPSGRTLRTKLLTIALYTSGGLVAGTIGKLLEDKS